MNTTIKNIKYIITVLLFTASCQLSNDLMDPMNEYNTDPLISINSITAAGSIYNNDRFTITCIPSESDLSVRYTIDGTDPSRTAGLVYTAPLTIELPDYTAGSIQIRAVAYDANRLSGIVSTTIILGDGTAAYPYEIATPAQLKNLSDKVNDGTDDDKYFRQVADIDLSSYATASAGTGWTPIGDIVSFTGNYNGGNFTISNLTINRATNNQGLFGKVAGNASLQNITLSDVNITGWGSTGALAGDVNGTGITVNNCDVTGTSQVFGVTSIGGLIGYSYNATLTNCSTSAIVTGTANNVGGLIGYFEAVAAGRVVDNCSSAGQVTGVDYVGGLIGNNGVSVFGATITDCSSSSTVSGQSNVGGLTGINHRNGSISSCFSTGDVTGSSSSVGGLVGNNAYGSTVNSSYATGDVTGTDNTGGLIGNNHSSGFVGNNNYATGNVIGANYTGGFAGYNVSTMGTGNYATGDVTGVSPVGGFIGYHTTTTITGCWYAPAIAANKVNGTGNNIGGFIGEAINSIITNCYSRGDVQSSGNNHGGFIGYNNNSDITYCYSTGDVSSTGSFYGGFIGEDFGGSGSYTACFWLKDGTLVPPVNTLIISDSGNPGELGGVEPRDQSLMQNQGTFDPPWIFTTVWAITSGINDNYPYLQ